MLKCSLCTHLLTAVILNECGILSNAFFLHLLNWLYDFYLSFFMLNILRYADITPYLHLCNKSHLIMVDNPVNVLLNWLTNYFIKEFYICVYQGYWPLFIYFFSILVWYWYQGNAGLVEFESFLSSSTFWKNLRIDINSFLNVW